jgi:hypothetical protein
LSIDKQKLTWRYIGFSMAAWETLASAAPEASQAR